MSKHIKLGKLAEDIAARYLEERCFLILDRNWTFRRKELDIIALKQGILHVIEVKSKSYANLGPPSKAVNHKKRRTIRGLAAHYLIQHNLDLEVQFDIISIVFSGSKHDLQYIEEAILPFDF